MFHVLDPLPLLLLLRRLRLRMEGRSAGLRSPVLEDSFCVVFALALYCSGCLAPQFSSITALAPAAIPPSHPGLLALPGVTAPWPQAGRVLEGLSIAPPSGSRAPGATSIPVRRTSPFLGVLRDAPLAFSSLHNLATLLGPHRTVATARSGRPRLPALPPDGHTAGPIARWAHNRRRRRED